MNGRRDLQALMPYVREQLAKGRKKTDIYDELELDKYGRININYYLRREKPIEDEITEYIIMVPPVREVRYFSFEGKRYKDVTEEFIDCGG